MSTNTRNLSAIDGVNVGDPDENTFDANQLQNYANDAAFEADHTAVPGSIYWNTTEKLVREYNGTAWQNDRTSYTAQTDSTTNGSAQDITPNTADQIIRLTHGSLISIRGIIPTVQKVITIVNAQASQAITILNEDLTATAANRILTGTGVDFSLSASQTIHLIYDSVSSRWRFSSVPSGSGLQLTDWSVLTNNLSFSASVSANALTIALKTKAGADATALTPIFIGFRNSTLTNGTYNVRSITGALSMVVSSGSTLGQLSAIAYPIFLYAIDNAGTVEIAVSTTLFDTAGVISTTAEGGAGAADSINVMYSTTARTNVPFRYAGKLVTTQATAGTWATAPSLVTTTDLSMPATALVGTTSGVNPAAGIVGENNRVALTASGNTSISATYVDSSATLTLQPGVYEITVQPYLAITTVGVNTTPAVAVALRTSANVSLRQLAFTYPNIALGGTVFNFCPCFIVPVTISVATTYKVSVQTNSTTNYNIGILADGVSLGGSTGTIQSSMEWKRIV